MRGYNIPEDEPTARESELMDEIERLKALREEHEQAWDALLEYVNEVEKSESVFLNYFDEFTDLCQKINDLRPGAEEDDE